MLPKTFNNMAVANLLMRRYLSGNQMLDGQSVTVPLDGSKVDWSSLKSASPSGSEFLYGVNKDRFESLWPTTSVVALLA